MCIEGSCYYTYFLCKDCFAKDEGEQKKALANTNKYTSFMRLSNFGSFTLQIPTNGGADPTSRSYSASFEVRFEKLPPHGQLQSFARFTVPDLSQPKKLHNVSVYLNGYGMAVATALPYFGNGSDVSLNPQNLVDDGAESPLSVGEVMQVHTKIASSVSFSRDWSRCEITTVNTDGSYNIKLDDSTEERNVVRANMRRVAVETPETFPAPLKKGNYSTQC